MCCNSMFNKTEVGDSEDEEKVWPLEEDVDSGEIDKGWIRDIRIPDPSLPKTSTRQRCHGMNLVSTLEWILTNLDPPKPMAQ